MKAGVILKPGNTPIYGDFDEPVPNKDEFLITVAASALTPVSKALASGTHYSSSAKVPFVVGIDGVGYLDDGRRVYFTFPRAPFGAMAQRTVTQSSHCIVLPDNLDSIVAASLANPGMSSWAALTEKAKLSKNDVVLVNGATGTSGLLAVQIAKYMGAKKVIATGRNQDKLQSLLSLGADVAISLTQEKEMLKEALMEQFSGDGINIVLDYLWGESAENLLAIAAIKDKRTVPLRFIQIGTASNSNITLPAAILRSSSIVLMGSGIGSISFENLLISINDLFHAQVSENFKISSQITSLSQIEKAWNSNGDRRIVFTIDE